MSKVKIEHANPSSSRPVVIDVINLEAKNEDEAVVRTITLTAAGQMVELSLPIDIRMRELSVQEENHLATIAREDAEADAAERKAIADEQAAEAEKIAQAEREERQAKRRAEREGHAPDGVDHVAEQNDAAVKRAEDALSEAKARGTPAPEVATLEARVAAAKDRQQRHLDAKKAAGQRAKEAEQAAGEAQKGNPPADPALRQPAPPPNPAPPLQV